MEDNKANALAEEIDGFYHRGQFAECIKRMDERLKESTDPGERAVALMAKSTCARHLKDFGLAETAAFAIDMEPLSPELRDYANLVRADILSATGQSTRAESLFLSILRREDAFTERRRDVLCKALAKLGFLYVTWNRYAAAVPLLEKASLLGADGFLRDDIDIDLAYCLQALGRLDEAKAFLKSILDREPQGIIVDAYYWLGAVQLQAEEYEAAIDSLQHALNHLPHGKVAESDILAALREIKELQNMNPIDRPPINSQPKPRVH